MERPADSPDLQALIEDQAAELRALRQRLEELEAVVATLRPAELPCPPKAAESIAPPALPLLASQVSEGDPQVIGGPVPAEARREPEVARPAVEDLPAPPPPPLAVEPVPVKPAFKPERVHPPRQASPSVPARPAAPAFLSTYEKPAAPEQPAEPAVSWEVKLATTWLPRIGGVFVIAGAAFFAMLITPRMGPVARVAMGYVVAALFASVGVFVQRRSTLAGRATVAVGLALGYFVSFAAHYIKPTHVMPAIPSVVLMVAFAGAIVGLAERWKSQVIATMGLGLGVLAALVSAEAAGAFALMALSVLALVAGVLLVRNEWRALTALALTAIYLAMPILWILLGTEMEAGVVLAHLGALGFYHLVFSAAFWKWGRAWVARERLAEEAPLEFATPRLAPSLLPYSTTFSVMNSLALVALSLLLVWITKEFWPQVHWLLLGLAAMEGARLLARPLRRGGLGNFHALTAFGLLCAGVVSALNGMAESAVLAMLTLVVAVAASRARELGWLRPVTVVSAGMAVRSFDPGGGGLPVAFLGDAMPGAFLLASALPWERIGVRHPRPPAHVALRVLEVLSGQVRSLIGGVLLGVALLENFSGGDSEIAVVALLATALVAGIVVLRAWAWVAAALLATLLAMAVGTENVDEAPWMVFHAAWVLVAFFLWGVAAARSGNRVASVFQGIAAGVLMLPLMALMVHAMHSLAPWRGVAYLPLAAAFGGLAVLNARTRGMGALVRPVVREEGSEPAPHRHPMIVTATSFATMLTVALGLVVSVAFDTTGTSLSIHRGGVDVAARNLIPALAWSGVLAVAWLWGRRRFPSESLPAWGLVIAAMATLSGAILLRHDLSAGSFAVVAFLLTVAAVAGTWWRDRPLGDGATLLLSALPLGLPAMLAKAQGTVDAPSELFLLVVAVLLASGRLVSAKAEHRLAPLDPDEGWRTLRGVLSGWRLVAGCVTALAALTLGPILPGVAVTASWGVVGAALLAVGLALRDKPMRITAFAVFGLATVRIFLVDMTGFSIAARALAFFAIGFLLVCAGVAYGVLRGRLEGGK